MAIFFDDDESDKFFRNLGKLPENFNTRKVVTDIANFLAARFKIKTNMGLDVDLVPFVQYALSTKAFRSKHGRQISPVNLQFTGQMLAALGGKTVSDTEAVVGFFDAEQNRKAIINQLGLGKVPVRRHFGLSDRDPIMAEGIDKIMGDEMDRALDKI